jgi:tRNA threonylcarbamoyladenosine biosynthesis protein TsaB
LHDPLLLAIETATLAASVAVLRGDAVLAARALPGDRPASETLLPSLIAALDDAKISLATLDGFAVSVGPGSFTGLRVGVATAKGLAFGSAQWIVPVPTLAALALHADAGDAPVAALLDARRGEVYAAIYAGDPTAQPLLGPCVADPESLASRLAEIAGGRACIAIGDGVAPTAEALRVRLGDRVELRPVAPDVAAVGRLGQRLRRASGGIAPEQLVPLYVRRAEAEVRRTGERFEPFDTPEKVS